MSYFLRLNYWSLFGIWGLGIGISPPLGERWDLELRSYRYIPCCFRGSVSAMMKTVKEHNIKADDVAKIKVEEIAFKFTALGGDIVGQEQCQKLQSFIMSMETAKNLGGLFELTTAR
jgi:hypothetical protein